MNSKIIYGIGATVAIAAAAVVWSCAPWDEEEVSEGVEFRGFNDALSGAIFTTLADGSAVNHNIYKQKEDVYLDGGPGQNAPSTAAALPPGNYYFQVTDPSGKELLSEDHISCRQVVVDERGVIAQVLSGTNYEWRGGAWVEADCKHEEGVDQDHGAVTVQLMPYADTPNHGGVYKVWMTPVGRYIGDPNFVPDKRPDGVNGEFYEPGNYHGFVPRYAKTDNFKVRGKPPIIMTVDKFHDANVNGAKDEGEAMIPCWGVSINDPTGATNRYFTPVSLFVTEGLWAVLEDMPDLTTITSSFLDGERLSIYPTADPLVLVTVEGLKGESHDVLYGDVGTSPIEACKFYDQDGDGVVDEGEPPVAGWRMQIQGTDVRGVSYGPVEATTGADGCAYFDDLLPGSYTVTELSSGGDWQSSGPTTVSVDISSTLTIGADGCGNLVGVASAEASFTNYCQGTAAFGTKGYWHNKNGLTELTDADIEYANGLAPYASPSSYFDAGDEPFDGQFEDGSPVDAAQEAGEELAPAGSARAEVSQFLVDRNADGDPREQLAQQLLAFIFNTRNRLDGPDAGIQQPDGTFVSARELIEQAIAAWQGDDAELQNQIAGTLDAFNNSDAVAFIYAEPCDLP